MQRQQRLGVRAQRCGYRVAVPRLGRIGRPRPVRRVADRHVAVIEVVRRRLVGDDVDRDTVGHQPGEHLGDIAHQRDGSRVGRPGEVGHGGLVARGDAIDPARVEAPPGPVVIDLDDQAAPTEVGNGQALGAAHTAQPGGDHPAARQRAVEMPAGDGAERLVREAEDALRSDVKPRRGGHLAVHGQAGVLEPAELVGVRPGRHHHGGRNQYPWRVRMCGEHRDRPAGLHDQRLGRAEPFQRADDRVVVIPRPGCPAAAAVHDQPGGVFGDIGVERVEEAAEHAFLLPAAAPQL